MTKGIHGTNRKDDNFTKKVVNFMQFFMGLDAAKKPLW